MHLAGGARGLDDDGGGRQGVRAEGRGILPEDLRVSGFGFRG
jgi:hypothetical protein